AGKATSLNDLLAQNPNFNRGQLGRDLAALYFDGAIAASHVDVAWLPAEGMSHHSALLG
ncbi:MAG: hypothetical protein JWQ88_2864, partial [Rhodoferax sp.]|nr:hypothetical protein [Rhodoferax sp.]